MKNQTKTSPIRILIADDHPVVCEGLAALINRRPDMAVVGEAANGHKAVALFRQQRPAVALVDLRMPELDGVGTIQEMRAIDPNARILVLTTYDGDEDIYRALQAGAQGYVLKDTPVRTYWPVSAPCIRARRAVSDHGWTISDACAPECPAQRPRIGRAALDLRRAE